LGKSKHKGCDIRECDTKEIWENPRTTVTLIEGGRELKYP